MTGGTLSLKTGSYTQWSNEEEMSTLPGQVTPAKACGLQASALDGQATGHQGTATEASRPVTATAGSVVPEALLRTWRVSGWALCPAGRWGE